MTKGIYVYISNDTIWFNMFLGYLFINSVMYKYILKLEIEENIYITLS